MRPQYAFLLFTLIVQVQGQTKQLKNVLEDDIVRAAPLETGAKIESLTMSEENGKEEENQGDVGQIETETTKTDIETETLKTEENNEEVPIKSLETDIISSGSQENVEDGNLEPLHSSLGENILIASEAVRKVKEEESNKHMNELVQLSGKVNVLSSENEKLKNEISNNLNNLNGDAGGGSDNVGGDGGDGSLEPLHSTFGEHVLVASEAVRKVKEEESDKHMNEILQLSGKVNVMNSKCQENIIKLTNDNEKLNKDISNNLLLYKNEVELQKTTNNEKILEITNLKNNEIQILENEILKLKDSIHNDKKEYENQINKFNISIKELNLINNKNLNEIDLLNSKLNNEILTNKNLQNDNNKLKSDINKNEMEIKESIMEHDKTQVLLNDWKSQYMTLEMELEHMTERALNPDIAAALTRKGAKGVHQLFESNPGLEVAFNQTLDFIAPSILKQRDEAQLLLNQTVHNIKHSIAPYTGPSYTPLVSGILVYGLLFIPLILTVYCLTSIKAVLKIRPVLIFMHLYCCLGCLIAAIISNALDEDALQVFYHSGSNTFLFFQIFMLIFYLLHILMVSFATIFKYVNFKEFIIRLIQLFIMLVIGMIYFDMVWEHSLVNESPEILYPDMVALPYGVSCLLYFIIFTFETMQRKSLLLEEKKHYNNNRMSYEEDMFRITVDSRLDEAERNAAKAE